jgi:hypothetical protein
LKSIIFYLVLFISAPAYSMEFMRCVRLFVNSFIIADWPKTKVVENGMNPWIPVRAHITRERLMWDFVSTGHLTLVFESEYKILFKSNRYDWTITFLRRGDQISRCDVGGLAEDGKKFWLARTLSHRGLLEYYFEPRFIHVVDLPDRDELF